MATQLPALNQSVEAEPFQNSTARDGVVVKTSPSATTDVARRPRHQTERLAMRPRYSSIAAAPTQCDSLDLNH